MHNPLVYALRNKECLVNLAILRVYNDSVSIIVSRSPYRQIPMYVTYTRTTVAGGPSGTVSGYWQCWLLHWNRDYSVAFMLILVLRDI
ncbi:hypothetical protein BDV36DRAFT_28685 [Aspergillus pseudocaelatus]|uniref:Uncharacterized protein n=1 Tax=Aspergillus pseudocaelatus TaxID=1825620 RepID=A0ABQ6WBK2_9EURO|nr:hypothetical protein BDV36DRAFT_28685 [Aspergillus pseudocaelatus]